MVVFEGREKFPRPFGLRLTQEVMTEIDALAERHNVTKGAIARGLIQHALEQVKANPSAPVVR